MFGSGARIICMITISERRRMAVLGQKMGMIIVLHCGAVLGSTILITAVPLTAATTTVVTASTTSTVFGWCAVLGGLCNPFPLFFLFSLFRFFWAKCTIYVVLMYYTRIERIISLLLKWVETLISPSLKRVNSLKFSRLTEETTNAGYPSAPPKRRI